MKTRLVVFLLVAFSTLSCKHKHQISSELLQAHAIQEEALSINKTIDNIPNISDVARKKRNEWIANMIEIPGIEHDHSTCNHKHRHPTTNVSDLEMIAVQQAWKDSIIQLKKSILLEQVQ